MTIFGNRSENILHGIMDYCEGFMGVIDELINVESPGHDTGTNKLSRLAELQTLLLARFQ